jgi:tRNA U34 5-carboxymethylaminomethyl modifying GTPase MnmE/TrmE
MENLPRATEENIAISEEDLKDTKSLEDLSQKVKSRIDEEENDITKFYSYFGELKDWLSKNEQMVQTSRDLFMDRVEVLQTHLRKTREAIADITRLTEESEKLQAKKLETKEMLKDDFMKESLLAKSLKFPHGLIKLARAISKEIGTEEAKAKIDLEVEKKTLELLKNISTMLDNIQLRLDDFERYLSDSPDLAALMQKFDSLVQDISREKLAFDKLSSFEQVHLNMLLELYALEDKKRKEEAEFEKGEEEQTKGSIF